MTAAPPLSGPLAPTGSRPRGLARLGAACARRPLLVLGAWLLLLIAVLAARGAAGGSYSDDIDLPGTQAYTGAQLLTDHQPAAGGTAGIVVFHRATGPLDPAAVAASTEALGRLPHVLSVTDPAAVPTPAGGSTVAATVRFDVRPKTLDTAYVDQLDAATAPARAAGVQVEYGGALDELTAPVASDRISELVGFGVALVVLLVGFGSVLAAVLPLLTALLAVAVGLGLLGLVAAVLTFGSTAPTLAVMIGLGVAIDYALFLTTRFRQLIRDGVDPVGAAGRTTATSGHAVLLAAGTVSVALLGLYASGIGFIGRLGLAAFCTVAVAAAGAVTLVPAGLGLVGRRFDAWTVRAPVAEAGGDSDGWHRYASLVARRPWWFAAAGLLLLAILSVPLLSIRLGHIDDGAAPASYTSRRAYDLVSEAYGPGANGTFTVVITPADGVVPAEVQDRLAATGGVLRADPLRPSPDGAILAGTITPTTGPQDAATAELFDRLVHQTLPAALSGTGASGYVTGTTASQLEFRDTLVARLPVIIALVVFVAFALILTTFRSLALAVKAAVLNVVSIGAAYGVVVAVFQWGWGRGLLGVPENVPIESYVPMMMFAIIFGLSMDYEIFLLARVREAHLAGATNTRAVATGLAGTARVISCAALIMVSVFGAFVAATSVVVKMLAVGLAASVLIDASLVRLILVPATMTLLGRATWWLPSWLDRHLPHLNAH